MKRLGFLLVSSAFLAIGMAAAPAEDKFPSRPVRVIVPYAPGGATDITARIIGDGFQKVTGQPMIVINKPGAYGLLAIEEIVKASPDGYTVMVGNVSTNAITPVLYANKMQYDYLKSVAAVTNLVDVPEFLLATTANDFPVKTLPELVAYANKNPGSIHYGSVGVGSYPHYDMAYFAKRAGDLEMTHLPNKAGASGMVTDLLRGDIQASFMNVATAAGQVQAAKFRALVVVSRGRLPDYPNVPTMEEAGYPGVGTIAWNGLFTSAATPAPVQQALFEAVLKALQEPETIEKLKKQNFNIVPSKSLADAKTWLIGEMKHWQTITNEVKIEIPNL